MSSLTISTLRSQYPGKSDKVIAQELLNKYSTMVAIVRYKNSKNASEFTNFGTCDSEAEIQGYFSSPYCHQTEMLIDQRSTPSNPTGIAQEITAAEIQEAFCDLCLEHMADEKSLTLNAGNNFYVCAECREFFCENCLKELPLSEGTHGVALCHICEKELIRALPGAYFKNQTPAFSTTPEEEAYKENVSSEIKTFFKKVKSIFNKEN